MLLPGEHTTPRPTKAKPAAEKTAAPAITNEGSDPFTIFFVLHGCCLTD
jgi:hypothetical protein